ncbi:Methyl-CpG DNA binding [Parasponia andersonii]|uniref:Methyl-CpG DNA binding n=1 Tax=Parasponia andersonii TaxID=3476 RepID=A0A2P5AX73_PARAD|nr:Methyl-CpG DNA binding [Parasponia andersonii]
MLPHPCKITVKFKRGENEFPDSSFLGQGNSTLQEILDVSSSEDDSHDSEDENGQSSENASKQLVLYDPVAENSHSSENGSKQLVLYDPVANGTNDIVPVPEPASYQPQRYRRFKSSRVLPSVGAFTVQCANCFKWRLIPTKEKYEEIREHILEQPFYCETAREWRPDISCDDPADISQDGSRLWAIDKPNIAQAPPGWQRLLRIRGEGSTKFADVYYVAPSGKRLRSMVEVQKYLLEHPEYTRDGVTMTQFSFQIPRPLQENYVRKRPARLPASCDDNRPLEPGLVNPLAWAVPDDSTHLQLRLPPPSFSENVDRPAKRQARTPSNDIYGVDPNFSMESR